MTFPAVRFLAPPVNASLPVSFAHGFGVSFGGNGGRFSHSVGFALCPAVFSGRKQIVHNPCDELLRLLVAIVARQVLVLGLASIARKLYALPVAGSVVTVPTGVRIIISSDCSVCLLVFIAGGGMSHCTLSSSVKSS